MKTKKRLPVLYKGRKFHGISKFDCRVISLITTPEGGSFFTVIPISPLEYRKKVPTKAKVYIIKSSEFIKNAIQPLFAKNECNPLNYTTFKVYSDYGDEEVIHIPNSMEEEIKIATEAANKMELI